ncbi:MAG: GTP 3',8-cyclase MoaA [Spirochaetaceae bacterium]|jgi:cyclic pyranopterin phosphate synthase|nr:GTP 3',8-cyclase MoaA [Spirochaetaceae bacterium]
MQDAFGRKIDYLRLSVTDRCPARCIYCVPPEGPQWISHNEIMRFEEFLRLARLSAELGITKIKVTGGEALSRRGLVPFMEALIKTNGIEKVSLTTNAVLLGGHIDALLKAGLKFMNISINTLNEDVFEKIMRINVFNDVMANLDAALLSGMNIKINCIPIEGYNNDDILPVAFIAKNHNAAVRFIELMPLGLAGGLTPVPHNVTFAVLEKEFGPLVPCEEHLGEGPARYYSVRGFKGRIGFISAVSHQFCAFCNRLRLTSTGKIKPCLACPVEIDIKTPLRNGADDAALKKIIEGAVMQKPLSHNFIKDKTQSGYVPVEMNKVGG